MCYVGVDMEWLSGVQSSGRRRQVEKEECILVDGKVLLLISGKPKAIWVICLNIDGI